MTLDEMELELEKEKKEPNKERHLGRMWLDVGNNGKAQYVTITEDGRIIPIEEAW